MKRKILAAAKRSVAASEQQEPERLRTGKRKAAPLKAGDFLLTALVMVLVVFGVIMVFSASYYYAISEEGTPYYYLIRDIPYAVIGTAAMLFMANFNYHHLQKAALPVFGIILILLLLIFTPLGITLNNATRWLNLGITVMPGELAKPACILFTAAWLSSRRHSVRSLLHGILPCVLAAGVVAVLVAMQPSTTTAITIVIIVFGIMFIAGMSWKYIGGIFALAAAAFSVLILTDEEGYRLGRITSFLDPFADPQGSGYQVVQSLLALGSGGLTGVGLGKSMQKTLYLPEPQNDFILAIIGEELGFIGLLILLAVYLLLIWRCIHIALNAPDRFGLLLASGITIMLGVQVILNVMIVTSLMPPTGISLPFVSWGGNSLFVFMGSMGVMLNVSRHSAR